LARLNTPTVAPQGALHQSDKSPNLSAVRERVEAEIASAGQPTDWEFSYWVVATKGKTG
jgi:hypothetical protein